MDAARFHSNYDSFPEALLLQTADGSWLSNPAAETLGLSQNDFDQLDTWDSDGSAWLAGRFFFVRSHRIPEGLLLILQPDAFMASSALKLSDQLRRHLSLAFTGLNALAKQLESGPKTAGTATADNSEPVIRLPATGSVSSDAITDPLSPHPATVEDNLSAVHRALYQLLRIATELDSCTAEDLPYDMQSTDLTGWFRSLGDELRHCCVSTAVTLNVELPNVPIYTMASPYLLDCLIAHLVSNALKASPNTGGEITLSLKTQGEQVVITVRGNGSVFSPSALTDPTWNQPIRLLPGHGLGLGLPIAQRIAALHHGKLMATPTKTGSQIVLSFPLADPGNRLSSPAAPRIEPSGGFSMVRIILSDALPSSAFSPFHHPESGKYRAD